MLSRIAESLYWIGRYVQRAEETARILDVHLQLMVEDPTTDSHESAATLLTVLGSAPGTEPVTREEILMKVQYDPASPCSVLASLEGAREAARRARETVPPELWEGLNTTWNAVRAGQLRQLRPTAGLTFVRERCALISGIADTSMSRDEGWQFLQLGRSIELIDMSARVMMWAAVARRSPEAWSNALRACGAMHAFRISYGTAAGQHKAAEFLLVDRLFPRSVVHTLMMAERALNELNPRVEQRGFHSDAVRLVGRVRSELEYQPIAEVLAQLPERLSQLQEVCAAVDEAITYRYFVGAASPTWSGGTP